ncbi:hypothetical protein [Thalassotalea marina]|uniref:Alpha/beta hydrolase n=1 Tax=Thalassotalea marina TaxID=1673741 RepID=A0A919EHY4_9GAMM|nr:hypothetical protein [Thalassotalea marina]GHF82448.1 hypothetical protein GCM10017161_07030 [Thalassotalea marina]
MNHAPNKNTVCPIDSLQYLAVGDQGGYSSSGNCTSSASNVDQIIKHIKNTGIEHVTLYFHGGLVNEADGAPSVNNVCKSAMLSPLANHHAVGFLWKTGFSETVIDNLKDIFDRRFGKSVMRWAIRAVLRRLEKNSPSSKSDTGVLSIDDISAEWEAASNSGRPPFESLEANIHQQVIGLCVDDVPEYDEESIALIEKDMQDRYQTTDTVQEWGKINSRIQPTQELIDAYPIRESKQVIFSWLKIAKAVVKIAARVIWRYIKKTDHGLQATIVEEILRAYYLSEFGQWVWGGMKEKAREMFEKPGKVGFDFLNKLSIECPTVKLNLVGHSAGSICILHLLQHKRKFGWANEVRKTIWWAPACKYDLFIRELLNHPNDFGEFRMYTMPDKLEKVDFLINQIPWLYPSSLLYFISGVLEKSRDYALGGMLRYYTGKKPYTSSELGKVKTFIESNKQLVRSNSISIDPGMQCGADDHGEFDGDEKTLNSMQHFLSN